MQGASPSDKRMKQTPEMRTELATHGGGGDGEAAEWLVCPLPVANGDCQLLASEIGPLYLVIYTARHGEAWHGVVIFSVSPTKRS